jgi:hypothetical protein
MAMKSKVLKLIKTAQMLFDPDTTDALTQQLYDPQALSRVIDTLFTEEELYASLRQKISDEINLAYHMARQSGTPEDLKIFEQLYYGILREYPEMKSVQDLDVAYEELERLFMTEHVDKYELYNAAEKLFDIPEFLRSEVEKRLGDQDPATIDALQNALQPYA